MDRKIKSQLIKVRNAVKRKLQALKEGVAGQELMLTKTYAPITKSIRDLKTGLSNEIKAEVKREKELPWTKDEVAVTSTPAKSPPKKIRRSDASTVTDVNIPAFPSFLQLQDIGEVDTTTAKEPTMQTSEEEAFDRAKQDYLDYINGPMFAEFLEEFDPLPRVYVEGLIKDMHDEYNSNENNLRRDKVRYEWTTNKFFIGDSEITFTGPNLCLGGVLCYKGTIGLYELLFKLHSNYPYSLKEKNEYAEILKRSSAIYNLRPQLSKTGGRGLLLDLNDKHVEYKYFDDVNELCDRLKLLIASAHAGNTSHNNEIISILEELRECGIIE